MSESKTKREPKRGSQEYEQLVRQEELILEATELLYKLMEKTGTSKADLARALNRTKGFVTQVLNGSRNMTLRTLSDFSFVLGYQVGVDAVPSKSGAVESTLPWHNSLLEWRVHPGQTLLSWKPDEFLAEPATSTVIVFEEPVDTAAAA